MKLNDIEKVVPMVMRLYRQLKSMNSPLVSSVLGYASDLLKNYKQEVTCISSPFIDYHLSINVHWIPRICNSEKITLDDST